MYNIHDRIYEKEHEIQKLKKLTWVEDLILNVLGGLLVFAAVFFIGVKLHAHMGFWTIPLLMFGGGLLTVLGIRAHRTYHIHKCKRELAELRSPLNQP